MDAFAKFTAEITALTEEAALIMKEWTRRHPSAQYHLSVDLTTMLVFGEVSPSTYAVRLLSSRRFEQQTELLRSHAGETHKAMAVRFRKMDALRQEQKLLDDLFKVLVERELPEASEYYAWEVHPSGQVYVRPSIDNHKDTKFVSYFSGNTQAAVTDL